jgi:hypothetical protein
VIAVDGDIKLGRVESTGGDAAKVDRVGERS